ncbi:MULTISPECIES: NUDIX domain-containing protein [Streptosporangium]|uniref:8-oxo-dGTP pyrophosphatase MutT (NUDIX family) n=1 Tax=Streptosporangium brasiliense TaxID=47480 RepID=A0ABT9RLY2_9ACTN|nr:NUDIX domain-containing protein [Streptosporangium brasiliense]MDP9870299.1 8-oxo-dGTP pyrophosphatase MutT (NUDIX family) [Streptosporangium brasiliense]
MSERTLYHDKWVHLRSADVELPDGRHLDHRLIQSSDGAYAAVVVRERVLLLWRHRFITDAWGWELPSGAINPGEGPAAAAAREVEEETGWRPEGPLRRLIHTQPIPGLLTARHYVFRADAATYIGPPADGFESERIAWVPLSKVRRLIDSGEILEGTTLTALLCLLLRSA